MMLEITQLERMKGTLGLFAEHDDLDSRELCKSARQ